MVRQWIRVSILVLGFCSQMAWANPIRVAICSQSRVKINAVGDAFHLLFPDREIELVAVKAESEIADQPVSLEWGRMGAQNRLRNARAKTLERDSGVFVPDYWVSIENFIAPDRAIGTKWFDQAVVLVQKGNEAPVEDLSRPVFFDAAFAIEAKNRGSLGVISPVSGFAVTIGKLISEQEGGRIASDNWQGLPEFGGVSRRSLLAEATVNAIVKTAIASVPDFPKSGINFLDVSPLLDQPELSDAVVNLIADHFRDQKIDLIAGLDARGFIFGSLIAQRMKLPFVMVRKQGKLPRPTHSETYDTEYSASNTIEISASRIEGKRVLLVDDLLATGGTLRAAENLFFKAGASEVFSTCLIELVDLKGVEKLAGPFWSLLKY